jgi:hypothetical protein
MRPLYPKMSKQEGMNPALLDRRHHGNGTSFGDETR